MDWWGPTTPVLTTYFDGIKKEFQEKNPHVTVCYAFVQGGTGAVREKWVVNTAGGIPYDGPAMKVIGYNVQPFKEAGLDPSTKFTWTWTVAFPFPRNRHPFGQLGVVEWAVLYRLCGTPGRDNPDDPDAYWPPGTPWPDPYTMVRIPPAGA